MHHDASAWIAGIGCGSAHKATASPSNGGCGLNWEAEQETLMLEARLLASRPEVAFDELKRLSEKIRAGTWDLEEEDKHEIALVSRNERLINLGLAAFGTNKEVTKALYKHALEPAEDASDASYKEGLRIGCLSNNTLPAVHTLLRFPESIIGPEETRRILAEGNDNETLALIHNPKLSLDLLAELYRRQRAFADPDRRAMAMVGFVVGRKRTARNRTKISRRHAGTWLLRNVSGHFRAFEDSAA